MFKKMYMKIFFVSVTMLCMLGLSHADASVQYTVKKGDNPSRIAKKFKVSVKDLQDANKLNPSKMMPGDKIVIPADKKSSNKSSVRKKPAKTSKHENKKKENTPEVTAKPEKPKNEQTAYSGSKFNNLYHTVRKGETLSGIAQKYSTTPDGLKELNSLKSAKLKNGQRLLVKHIGPKTYTVKKGDNIWKIAKKFNMDTEDLMTLNELESPSLKIGRKLYLEEIIEPASLAENNEILTKNIEEEIQNIAASQEFTEQSLQDRLIIFAKKLMNIPYKFGGNSILGIDCSGYVKKVYGFLGIDLPRTARQQFTAGEAIDKSELSIGDLVFFRTYASFPSHVGIYLGNNLFIHASSKGKKVTVDSLDTPYYLKRFLGGKRIIEETAPDTGPDTGNEIQDNLKPETGNISSVPNVPYDINKKS